MGIDYALVHLKYTIPPCLALTLLYRPFFTPLDVFKIVFLITIAVISTIPWDSYLIRTGIWTYPRHAVLGPTVWSIPIEELFFFIIQTYGVSLLYLLLSKPTFHSAYLPHPKIKNPSDSFAVRNSRVFGTIGQLALSFGLWQAWRHVQQGGTGMYMGLIVVWAFPFLLLLWSLTHNFVLRLPKSDIIYPILFPTLYLWVVDTLALKRGTWVIVEGTKLGVHLWDGLEIEEAVFFFCTNCLVTFGLIACDYSLALIETFSSKATNTPLPSPWTVVKTLILPNTAYDAEKIRGLSQADQRLRSKSRSFYIASATFQGRLRIDLVLLYSFCRTADDLVDNAGSFDEAVSRIHKMRTFLDLAYGGEREKLQIFVDSSFPPEVRLAFLQLPVNALSRQPLVDLLNGFDMDLTFGNEKSEGRDRWPIRNEEDLIRYGFCVAGTVAELCMDLVFYHHGENLSEEKRVSIKKAGVEAGEALQIVNISRDFQVDAAMNRVYIPLDWLKSEGLTPEDIVADPCSAVAGKLRTRLLKRAFELYEGARGSIDELPDAARGPIRVATESYMEIGRVLQEEGYRVQPGRATVGRWRRIRVAWTALSQ